MIHEFGYVAPQVATDTFVRKVLDRTLPILDIGCGTGLVGKLLHQAGYEHIDGTDLSPEMLEKASSLQVYQNLWEGDLTGDINIRPIYGGIVCVGVFSRQRDHPFLIPKLLNGLRPGVFLLQLSMEKVGKKSAGPNCLTKVSDNIISVLRVSMTSLTSRHKRSVESWLRLGAQKD